MVHFSTVGFLSKTIYDIFVLANKKMSWSHNLAVIYVQAHFWQIIIYPYGTTVLLQIFVIQ